MSMGSKHRTKERAAYLRNSRICLCGGLACCTGILQRREGQISKQVCVEIDAKLQGWTISGVWTGTSIARKWMDLGKCTKAGTRERSNTGRPTRHIPLKPEKQQLPPPSSPASLCRLYQHQQVIQQMQEAAKQRGVGNYQIEFGGGICVMMLQAIGGTGNIGAEHEPGQGFGL